MDYLGSNSDNSDSIKTKHIPRTLNLGRCNITDYNVDVERQNARQFVKTLQNVMVPKLLSFRTCVEVCLNKLYIFINFQNIIISIKF